MDQNNAATPGANWAAWATERRPLASLVPYARNARTHSAAQVAQIAASIREWGWTVPVLVDEAGTIIAGHGRLLAAESLGIGEVPVIVARGWTEAQKRAYVIADNKLAENAGWDKELLRLEAADLAELGFNLPLLGFTERELQALSGGKTGLTDPDATPPLAPDPIARVGDLFELGNHRLLCGDSTNASDVARLLDGAKPQLMVTDPPYGVEYDPAWRNRVRRKNGSVVGARATGVVTNDEIADWREAYALFPGDVAYVWNGALKSAEVAESLLAVGFGLRAQIVWAKKHFVIGRGDYHWQHELCWYAVRKGKPGRWAAGRDQGTVWDIDAPNGWAQIHDGPDAHQGIHSTQKPVECMRRPIINNSEIGEAVYEPFAGSGSTIIAAEMMERAVFAMEISPLYVDVAVKRWENFTGKQARKL
ncbi:DNA methyltransferase [Bradyrhizobium sp. UFLA05-109]